MILTWLREIRDHKWLAVRALLVGWIALFAIRFVILWLVNLDEWLWVRGVADIRTWWPDERAPIPHLLIGASAHGAMGWLVGYFHREHRVPMVLLYCLSVLLLLDLPRFIPAAIASFEQGAFWLIVALDLVFLRVPIVLGGIGAVRAKAIRGSLKKVRVLSNAP